MLVTLLAISRLKASKWNFCVNFADFNSPAAYLVVIVDYFRRQRLFLLLQLILLLLFTPSLHLYLAVGDRYRLNDIILLMLLYGMSRVHIQG